MDKLVFFFSFKKIKQKLKNKQKNKENNLNT